MQRAAHQGVTQVIERICATAAGVALLAAAAAPAQAASSGIYFRLGDGSPLSYDSATDPVSANEVRHYDYGSSYQRAAASFAHQTARARSALVQNGTEPPGSWITADTEADYSKDLVLPTGIYGPAGTLISMPVTLHFDGGSLASGGLFGSGARTLSSIDTYFSFDVFDLDEQICDEGCRPAKIASLGFRGYVSFDSGFSAAGRESVANYSWRAEENGVTVAEDSYDFYNYEKGVFGGGEAGYSVDTGLLNLNLVSRTGHTLRFESSLDVFAQSMSINAWSNVVGDFGRTFDADLFLPDGGAPEGETLGVYTPAPVPLPASAWSLVAGVALLALRGRRGTRRA